MSNTRFNRQSPRSIPEIHYDTTLPIFETKEEILRAFSENQVIIVAGATGSGKTTQLPLFCLEAGRGTFGKIGCTQPRRIAATSIATRVADQLHCQLGKEVGYKIRFADLDSDQTSIKFMTDGILLTELETDRNLYQYDTIIIDEAHERSLNIDFLIGYIRKLITRRNDLKIIISSATINTELFSKAFNNAPIIEVSGTMYPVELLYRQEEESEDKTYIDYAVTAIRDCIDLYGSGDMLVFMPTERDIHETCDRLRGARLDNTMILPLYSRLSRSEQELIFQPQHAQKIIVATNIAETSITVPGIRFVIDTGLARISHYAPRLRTSRLPIEPISRASADQRKGRCGRVREGICIRLYTAEEFLGRDEFTLPEIQRSNLAGIILMMTAHKLGFIEKFPFLEPPSPQAINDGYTLLKELGALDNSGALTSLGREMSRLPLDPNVARMVIEARKEGALREVKIIASGLSIVDPRERPIDKQAEADAMHRTFIDPLSDFLSLLNIWDTFRDQWKSLGTQNKMRRFCKEHFLNFNRMREWHDIHSQLSDILSKMHGFNENTNKAEYDQIHRSLYSGLITNCAMKDELGKYKAVRGRDVIIFPGSSLSKKGPDWIMCHEVVETSQVFARTVASLKPEWIEQLAGHLCKHTYDNPFFDSETGFVRATERISLYGLTINIKKNAFYGNVDPTRATDIFIRQGLVEQQLKSNHRFYINNCKVKADIEKAEEKLRTRTLYAGDETLVEFYKNRLVNVASLNDLNKVIKEHGTDNFLFVKEEDITAAPLSQTLSSFPDNIKIGGKNFSLKYRFEPGSERDGVTIRIPETDASYIPPETVGWLLPALWPSKIRELLRTLPKELRKQMMPINERADEIASVIVPAAEPFGTALCKAIKVLYNINVTPSMFDKSKVAQHLEMRVELFNKKGEVVLASRDPVILQKGNTKTISRGSWDDYFTKYERKGLTDWPSEDIPETIELAKGEGLPLYGYPAIKSGDSCVDLILCTSKEEAEKTHGKGVEKLLEIKLNQEFAWVEKDMIFSQQLKLLCAPIGGDQIKTLLLQIIRSSFLSAKESPPRRLSDFESLCASVKEKLRKVGYETVSVLESVMNLYKDCIILIDKEKRGPLVSLRKELRTDLDLYIARLKNGKLSFEMFRQYPRYFKAFMYRIQRAYVDPSKYQDKKLSIVSYTKLFSQAFAKFSKSVENKDEVDMIIEEYIISLFAQQEVKTLFPVSTKRLDTKLSELCTSVK